MITEAIRDTGSLQKDKQANRMSILILISAFGPYVFPQAGLRLEHFFIYGVFLFVIIRICISRHLLQFNQFVFALLIFFCMTLLWITTISISRGGFKNLYGALAGLENFLQPISLLLILTWYFSKLSHAELLKVFNTACITIIALLCINSVIAIMSVFFDTWPFLKYFVVAGEAGGTENRTVSQLAATMGRFSGIFNQPFESGLAYSLGMLCWVYLANTTKKITFSGWIAVILLLIGGALSVSKVFILIGFPFALVYYCWINIGTVRFSKRNLTGFLIMPIAFIIGVVYFVDDWTGFSFFLRLFDFTTISDQGVLDTYTAGRLTADGSIVMNRFTSTWAESPIFGFGVPVEGVLDNAYIEFFYLGGMVALLFYSFMLLILLYIPLARRKKEPKCAKFLFLLWLLTIIAGIGAPVFTINRTSIFYWVLLVLAILIVSRRPGFNYFKMPPSQDTLLS